MIWKEIGQFVLPVLLALRAQVGPQHEGPFLAVEQGEAGAAPDIFVGPDPVVVELRLQQPVFGQVLVGRPHLADRRTDDARQPRIDGVIVLRILLEPVLAVVHHDHEFWLVERDVVPE